MTDSILIQGGVAHEIWRGVAKADLPPMTADLLSQVVEVADGDVSPGDVWDGSTFSKPALSKEEVNAPIYAQLDAIDAKSIRALREGNAARLADLEAQATALRPQLVK